MDQRTLAALVVIVLTVQLAAAAGAAQRCVLAEFFLSSIA